MIISFTGHRPNKIGGFKIPNETYNWIFKQTEIILKNIKPNKAYCGMALGYDQMCAEICIKLQIPFVAAIPFKGQESVWPKSSRDHYFELLSKADKQIIVSDGAYDIKKMQIRNEFMVDHADIVLACWDGSPGGTGNCMQYAIKQMKNWIRINPNNKLITSMMS